MLEGSAGLGVSLWHFDSLGVSLPRVLPGTPQCDGLEFYSISIGGVGIHPGNGLLAIDLALLCHSFLASAFYQREFFFLTLLVIGIVGILESCLFFLQRPFGLVFHPSRIVNHSARSGS